MSFHVLIDETERKKNPELFEKTVKWTKDLMRSLYGDKTFFKEAEAKNPHFMDLIIEKLIQAADALPKTQKLKSTIDLSNLDLGPELKEVFYLMLKGCPRETEAKQSVLVIERPLTINPNDGESQEDEAEVAEEAMEYTVPEGYDSLLNYITLKKTTQIRVYLASTELLKALLNDRSAVSNVIETRNRLYQAVKSESMDPAAASEELKSAFQGYLGNDDEKYLDLQLAKQILQNILKVLFAIFWLLHCRFYSF